MATSPDNPAVTGVKVEAGIKLDKTMIIWLSVITALATIGIIIAFVVLGRRFCCASKKRKGKETYLDNRNVFEAWNGEAPLHPQPEMACANSRIKANGQDEESLWEITIPPVVVVDQAPPSSPRGVDRRYRQDRFSTWNRTMRNSVYGQQRI